MKTRSTSENWKGYLLRPLPFLAGISTGILVGVFVALSLLRTAWGSFRPDFFFWASIIMTFSSAVFIGFSIWQYLAAQSERKKGDAQVKIWMQNAQGLEVGMRTIAVNSLQSASQHQYSSVNDVGMAVYALAESAKGLYQSLYEERCVTEEEYSAQQREIGDAMHKKRIKNIEDQPPPPVSPAP